MVVVFLVVIGSLLMYGALADDDSFVQVVAIMNHDSFVNYVSICLVDSLEYPGTPGVNG
jgi:hypothetical protein